MRLLSSIVLCLLVSVGRPAIASADDEHVETFDETVARARDAAEAGKFRKAAGILAPLVDAYPQDYEVALLLAWYTYSAGDYADAERAYRVALARAPASVDARLGLAWTFVQRLHCEDAARELVGLEEDPRAAEIARVCAGAKLGVAKTAELGAAYVQSHYPGDSTKSSAAGVFLRGTVRVSDDWALGLAYRYSHVATHAASKVSAFSQHEVFASAAWSSPVLGLRVHAAVVDDGSGLTGVSKHVGLVGRYTSFGELQLAASVSAYRDRTITRIAPSWTIPVVGPLRLVPGFAVQSASGDTLLSAGVSVLFDWPGLSLWAGAKYGIEERPAYLDSSVIYNINSRIEWGAHAGIRVRFSEGFGVTAAYSYDRLHVDSSSTTSALQTFSVGPIITF